jgi:hypothetical protein
MPGIPWQMTGNHWVCLPSIHPDDASVHLVGLLHRGARGAVEFAGTSHHLEGAKNPFLALELEVRGKAVRLAESGIAWERLVEWLPSFRSMVEGISVRGSIFAPHGRDADVPGMVYLLSLENRSDAEAPVSVCFRGCLGHRQLRVRTARAFSDEHRVTRSGDEVLLLDGDALPGLASLAIAAEGGAEVAVDEGSEEKKFSLRSSVVLQPGEKWTTALYLAAGAERDGATATLAVMRRRGWHGLLEETSRFLQGMLPGDNDSGAGRLIDRNCLFAYFYAVGRAIDDAQFYTMRTRVPWHAAGITSRDWETLMWVLPAVRMMDPPLARELILRSCEVHGYAPGYGLHYLDGAVFEPGFSLEGASAYALAVDRYIQESGDDQIVEEPILADTLYLSHEEITRRRDPRYPLYSTEVLPDGQPAPMGYTLHGNAVAAQALEVLSHTLDEDTARQVEAASVVRTALRKHFLKSAGESSVLAGAIDLRGGAVVEDLPAASALWLPLYEGCDSGDAAYRQTIAELPASGALVQWCARLVGVGTAERAEVAEAAEFLRKAPLFEGIACEVIDAEGRGASGAGDAALAGLLGWTMWSAMNH